MDFIEQLKTHLEFLERSSQDYDAGDKNEALRIAVSLRVLFHDTRNSTSLLRHLGRKGSTKLISTIGTGKTRQEIENRPMISIPIMLSPEGVKPILGKHSRSKELLIDDWWNEVIMSQEVILTRKDVVLAAANQDGGAHVDSNPNRKTQELREGIGTFTKTVNGVKITEDLINHHFPLLRQLAYEILNSSELTRIVRTHNHANSADA